MLNLKPRGRHAHLASDQYEFSILPYEALRIHNIDLTFLTAGFKAVSLTLPFRHSIYVYLQYLAIDLYVYLYQYTNLDFNSI